MRNNVAYNIGDQYPTQWKIDSTKTSTLQFLGYEGAMIPSKVTGKKRLKYDRSKPFTKDVTYYNYFKPVRHITIPHAYIIPQSWHKVIDRLKDNSIALDRLKTDTILHVETYRISNFKTVQSPFEGHYMHYKTEVEMDTMNVTFRKGDYIVRTDQKGIRYLLETLEPTADDSFFNWNFFDSILQQKEHFSPYVWEDKALEILETNPHLKRAFETKKKDDTSFADSAYAQLDWIHKRSKHYEFNHRRYPVYRLMP